MYQIFGDAPAIKILDWLLENQEYDHSMKEISDGAELSMIVTKRNFDPLLQHGVVKVSRQIGRDSMYVLDGQSRCTKAIIEFDKQIAKCCEDVAEADDEYDEEYAPGLPEPDYSDDGVQMMAGPLEH